MSAALWCDELRLTSVLIEGSLQLGGQLRRLYNPIENYPGLRVENGIEMLSKFEASLASRNFVSRIGIKASAIDTVSMKVHLESPSEEVWTGRAVILAMGVRRRVLGVPGESEFAGRGILESGVRDKDLVKGKRVLIVGGGDAAFENAIKLAESASSVAVAFRRSEPTARREFVSEAKSRSNIELLSETVLTEISGDTSIRKASVKNSNGASEFIDVDAVLIRIGVEPNSDLVSGIVDLDDDGYIKVDHRGMTSVDRMYAAGDIANSHSPTLSTAAGTATSAVKAIYRSIMSKSGYTTGQSTRED